MGIRRVTQHVCVSVCVSIWFYICTYLPFVNMLLYISRSRVYLEIKRIWVVLQTVFVLYSSSHGPVYPSGLDKSHCWAVVKYLNCRWAAFPAALVWDTRFFGNNTWANTKKKKKTDGPKFLHKIVLTSFLMLKVWSPALLEGQKWMASVLCLLLSDFLWIFFQS